MKLSLILACLWVLAATVVAMLPMRRQYIPGVALLVAAPVLVIWLGFDFGWWLSVVALLAFGSMFRNPLRYFYRRARGQEPKLPE